MRFFAAILVALHFAGSVSAQERRDPLSELTRLDANQDGTLEAGEVPQRAAGFLRAAAQKAGLAADPPWSIEKLASALTGKPPESEEQGKSTRKSSSQPLVPGFGEESDLVAPPGFDVPLGTDLRPVEDRYDSRVIDYVKGIFERYDTNKNEQLDPEEWENVRWSSDPKASDLNKDGILNMTEMCERIAVRWKTQSNDDRGRVRGGRNDDDDDDESSASYKIRRYAKNLLTQYDSNKDGVLQKDEWSRMRNITGADANSDSLITLDELTAKLSGYGSSSGSESSSNSSSSTGSSRDKWSSGRRSWQSGSSDTPPSDRDSYRFLTPTERLPKGLPSWFTRNDANGDGQVSMGEFSSSWNDSTAAEFMKSDLNGDGVITPEEALQAGKK